jgi:membrane protease YdiL (CAAX protease family)
MPYDSTVEVAPASIQPAPPPPHPAVATAPAAHWLHTVALLAVLVVTTFYGHHRATSALISDNHRIVRYLTSIGLEWLLLGGVMAGIYHRRAFLRTAFCNRANTWAQTAGLGLVVYVLGFVAIIAVGGVIYFTPLARQHNEAVVLAMVPRTAVEFMIWFVVSLSAGICEELIFRGYLLQQLGAWTRRPVLAIFIAALLFGGVHLYEGLAATLPLAALAVVYGFVVKHFKGDLRAVIVAHTLQDFVVAFLVLARPFLERHQPPH